ncbi:MAG TPA: TonB family protein [Bacteroidales bacterium]|nr:TonB family protein [Bacteroidales bacterium]HPT01523.1 TonB family protein [Bacteroidales bacterium]
MAKINIFSDDWCNLVFESRPKEYGAYLMRSLSSKRHRIAIITTIILFLLVFTLPGLIKRIIPAEKETNVEVTTLSNIKLEKSKTKEIEQPKIEQELPQKVKSTIKFTPPVIKDDAEVKDEEVMKTQEEVSESKLSISTADVKGNSQDADAVDLADLQQQQTQVVEEEEEEKPFIVVEQIPEFPGGVSSMNKFLKDNIRYPQIARESGITGTVFTTFVVSKTGKISDVKILRGIGGGCDEEAIRVIKAMPAWIPGKQNGRAVPVQFNLPIKFTLAG